MKEPCRSCPRKEIDFGGCRCQAFALYRRRGQHRPSLLALAAAYRVAAGGEAESHAPPTEFTYRRVGGATKKATRPCGCDLSLNAPLG